jgi:hypothetical protein
MDQSEQKAHLLLIEDATDLVEQGKVLDNFVSDEPFKKTQSGYH